MRKGTTKDDEETIQVLITAAHHNFAQASEGPTNNKQLYDSEQIDKPLRSLQTATER